MDPKKISDYGKQYTIKIFVHDTETPKGYYSHDEDYDEVSENKKRSSYYPLFVRREKPLDPGDTSKKYRIEITILGESLESENDDVEVFKYTAKTFDPNNNDVTEECGTYTWSIVTDEKELVTKKEVSNDTRSYTVTVNAPEAKRPATFSVQVQDLSTERGSYATDYSYTDTTLSQNPYRTDKVEEELVAIEWN